MSEYRWLSLLWFFFIFFHQYFLAMALRLHHPMLDADVEYTFLFRDFYFCMLLPLGRCFLFLWIFTDTTIPERKSHENAWFNFKMKKVLVTFWNNFFLDLHFAVVHILLKALLPLLLAIFFLCSPPPTPPSNKKFPNSLFVAPKYTTFSAC